MRQRTAVSKTTDSAQCADFSVVIAGTADSPRRLSGQNKRNLVISNRCSALGLKCTPAHIRCCRRRTRCTALGKERSAPRVASTHAVFWSFCRLSAALLPEVHAGDRLQACNPRTDAVPSCTQPAPCFLHGSCAARSVADTTHSACRACVIGELGAGGEGAHKSPPHAGVGTSHGHGQRIHGSPASPVTLLAKLTR